jgi:hypothetical protein
MELLFGGTGRGSGSPAVWIGAPLCSLQLGIAQSLVEACQGWSPRRRAGANPQIEGADGDRPHAVDRIHFFRRVASDAADLSAISIDSQTDQSEQLRRRNVGFGLTLLQGIQAVEDVTMSGFEVTGIERDLRSCDAQQPSPLGEVDPGRIGVGDCRRSAVVVPAKCFENGRQSES